MNPEYIIKKFHSCLYFTECDNKLMDILFKNLPQTLKKNSLTIEENNQNDEEITPNSITLKAYIDMSKRKDDGKYKINISALEWFFKRKERLDTEDLEKILSTNTFSCSYSYYSNNLDLEKLNTILKNSDSKSPLILESLCTIVSHPNDNINKLIEYYLKKGVKPTEKVYTKCFKEYENARFFKDNIELYQLFKKYS